MRCAKAAEQLQLYIDKQLTLDQVRTLEAHLATCAACREELFLLETIESALQNIEFVAEPADLTQNIMRRVALIAQRGEEVPAKSARESTTVKEFASMLFRPSLAELLAAGLLATITTLGVVLGQASVREALLITGGHDIFSLIFLGLWHIILGMNSGTLMLVFWVLGTILGIWITLALAGNEVRTQWLKAMLDRLPVW
jgi:predicted anti-sigma-YlaC factor YlaD